MAFVVRFGRPQLVGIQTKFSIDPQKAMGSNLNHCLPKRKHYTGEQMRGQNPEAMWGINPGQRGYFPVGVDKATPGYTQDNPKLTRHNQRRVRI